MNKFIALCLSLLSLYGVDIGGTTFVDRVQANGVDVVHSRVVAHPAFARFECIGSASGRCHYTLFDDACDVPPSLVPVRTSTCRTPPIERFALATGEQRRLPAMPAFRPCVRSDARVPGPDCAMAGQPAAN